MRIVACCCIDASGPLIKVVSVEVLAIGVRVFLSDERSPPIQKISNWSVRGFGKRHPDRFHEPRDGTGTILSSTADVNLLFAQG